MFSIVRFFSIVWICRIVRIYIIFIMFRRFRISQIVIIVQYCQNFHDESFRTFINLRISVIFRISDFFPNSVYAWGPNLTTWMLYPEIRPKSLRIRCESWLVGSLLTSWPCFWPRGRALDLVTSLGSSVLVGGLVGSLGSLVLAGGLACVQDFQNV